MDALYPNPAMSINWRASLVPAAAVIPAPRAYTNIVAVKKLVVDFRVHRGSAPSHSSTGIALVSALATRAGWGEVDLGAPNQCGSDWCPPAEYSYSLSGDEQRGFVHNKCTEPL